MTAHELGRKLKEMYDNAAEREKVLQIHIFGIKFADEITNNTHSVKDIIKTADIYASYDREVRKGMNLSKYVKIIE